MVTNNDQKVMVWKIWGLVWVKWRQYEYILFIKPLRPQNVEIQVGPSANTLQLSNNCICTYHTRGP